MSTESAKNPPKSGLFNTIETTIFKSVSTQVKYIPVVDYKTSTGKVRSLYDQMIEDFQITGPLALHSISPNLMSGAWAMARETFIAAGRVPREIKELVASVIAKINACPFCMDAHTAMLIGKEQGELADAIMKDTLHKVTDSTYRGIIEWSLANRKPTAAILRNPPFSADEAPEIIGTALAFHYTNRMVSVFLNESPLPIPAGFDTIKSGAHSLFGRIFGKNIVNRDPEPGLSLTFLKSPETKMVEPSWTIQNSNIAQAFSNYEHLMQSIEEKSIPAGVSTLLTEFLNKWNGEEMPLDKQWIDEALKNQPAKERIYGEIALLTAVAPYRITQYLVDEFYKIEKDPEKLLELSAWASFSATGRIASWLS